MKHLLSEIQWYIKVEGWEWVVSWPTLGLCGKTRCPWGCLHQSWGRERERKERAGQAGLGTQEGRRVWLCRGTQRTLHSARGWRRILALCGCWMASRSSTNTPLWLWKSLLCRATNLLDTPSTESVPAHKVNTPALDWLWKTFLDVSRPFTHQPFHVTVHHTVFKMWKLTCLCAHTERRNTLAFYIKSKKNVEIQTNMHIQK